MIHEFLQAYQGSDDHHKVQLAPLSALPKDHQATLMDYQREIVRYLSAISRRSHRSALKGIGASFVLPPCLSSVC
ncbi:MAG: hypothetical protein AAGF94_03540 [Pseudomonadota bacterium]